MQNYKSFRRKYPWPQMSKVLLDTSIKVWSLIEKKKKKINLTSSNFFKIALQKILLREKEKPQTRRKHLQIT